MKHFRLRTEKKEQKQLPAKQSLLIPEYILPGTLCCNYLHIPDRQTDVVQSFVVDSVEHTGTCANWSTQALRHPKSLQINGII